jgi:hypothetical protein
MAYKCRGMSCIAHKRRIIADLDYEKHGLISDVAFKRRRICDVAYKRLIISVLACKGGG